LWFGCRWASRRGIFLFYTEEDIPNNSPCVGIFTQLGISNLSYQIAYSMLFSVYSDRFSIFAWIMWTITGSVSV